MLFLISSPWKRELEILRRGLHVITLLRLPAVVQSTNIPFLKTSSTSAERVNFRRQRDCSRSPLIPDLFECGYP